MTIIALRKSWLIFALIVASGLSARGGELRLKSDCECRGSLVRLGDIAEIRGVTAKQQTELAKIELIVAPPKGKTRVIRQNELRELLTQRGIDVPTFQFAGADEVTVRAASGIGAAGQSGGSGSFSSDTASRTRADAALFVVPLKTIARGETIRATDVELKPMPKLRREGEFVSRVEDVVGREATRQLDPGQPIESGSLQQPLLVRRGETITVTARAAGVHVRTSVKALEDGAYGDAINVETLEKNKQKFLARIVGQQQAEVFAGVQIVPAMAAAPREALR